jgi:23S rRNA (uracil1939-C5)-methyltransferase
LQRALEQVRNEIHSGELESAPKDLRAVVGDAEISLAPPLGGYDTRDISLAVAGEHYLLNAESFFQVSADLLPKLIAEAIGDAAGEVALDLYCGAGLFTLPLARRFGRVVGVELNAHATRFARLNLQRARLTNVEILTASVGLWLTTQTREHKVDFLLLDPPRVGAENIVIKGIIASKPKQIAYVSSDPATLARDLKKLIAAGYEVISIRAFDMFPQTHHVETVVRLQRG